VLLAQYCSALYVTVIRTVHRIDSMASLGRLVFVAALCWLPCSGLGLKELKDKTLQPDGRPPPAFSAARHKTTTEMEKVPTPTKKSFSEPLINFV
jgi:hypothetical protein